jgi:UMF1 family MFS transporter
MSEETASDTPTAEPAPKTTVVAAWIVTDVGNALFYGGVVGIFFPLWATQVMSGDDATVAYTLAAAMVTSLLVAPLLGTLTDHTARRMPLLAAGKTIGVAATLMLGGSSLYASLALFALAIVAVNSADIAYNAMLTEVSTEANRGKIGGLGVGIGYLGVIMAVVIGLVFVDSRGYVFGFRAIAILVFLVSIPVVVLLKERPRHVTASRLSDRVRGVWSQLQTTLAHVEEFPGLLRYLVARFWYTTSLYTASTFGVLYATETVGYTPRQVQFVILAGILVAIPCGLLWGIFVDRVGPRRSLVGILAGWTLVLLLAVAIPWLDLPRSLWWVVGVMSGISIAGIWTADRPYLLTLAPPRFLGGFFGLHSMTGRLSSIVGPFTWGAVSVTLGLGQPAAVLSLAACAVIALVLVAGPSDRARAGPGRPSP